MDGVWFVAYMEEENLMWPVNSFHVLNVSPTHRHVIATSDSTKHAFINSEEMRLLSIELKRKHSTISQNSQNQFRLHIPKNHP